MTWPYTVGHNFTSVLLTVPKQWIKKRQIFEFKTVNNGKNIVDVQNNLVIFPFSEYSRETKFLKGFYYFQSSYTRKVKVTNLDKLRQNSILVQFLIRSRWCIPK